MPEQKISLWQWKSLLLCNAIAAFLLLSFFNPWTFPWWQALDDVVFFKLNGSLRGNIGLQHFWAMANHYLADWVEDIVIFLLYYVHVRSFAKELRRRKIAELTIATMAIIAIIFLVNRVLFRYFIVLHRESPTLIYDDAIRLSNEIHWLHIKDESAKCFPGDHATTALLFAASYIILASGRHAAIAALCAVFWCIPRIITGAHWFSDAAVGSCAICFVCLSWIYCTPLFSMLVDRVEMGFARKQVPV